MAKFEYIARKDGEASLITDRFMILFLYAWGRDYFDLNHNNALKMANLAEMMYLKDSNPTPLGELADYVAVHYERLSEMDSIYDMLSDFYDNCGNLG